MRLIMAMSVLVLFAVASAVGAQTFRGGVQGGVTDTTGAALPGADVTATNEATGDTSEFSGVLKSDGPDALLAKIKDRADKILKGA